MSKHLKFDLKKIKNISNNRGYCKRCGEPLGFIENYNIFCYKCSGYEKSDITISINEYEKKLELLRLKFRNGIINGNVKKYLYEFLQIGEESSRSQRFSPFPNIPIPIQSPLANWDALIYVITNLGIKWILEDLNYYYKGSEEFSQEILSIPNEWLIIFAEKTNIENDLGINIKDHEGNIYHYYFQKWIFYGDSLYQYGIVDPVKINTEEYIEMTKNMVEKESDLIYMNNFVRYRLPIIFLSALYFIYPDKKEKMFSFDDIFNVSESNINQSFLEPYSIAKIYTFYSRKRSLLEKQTNKRLLFIHRTLSELKYDLKNLPWYENLLPYFIISSQVNPMSFPLLVQFNNIIIITPSRLEIVTLLMYEKINHKKIHKKLHNEFEKVFQEKVKNFFEEIGVIVVDPINKECWTNIMDKKKNNFEFDLLGLYEDNILIIECKSFRPAPFYHLKEYQERRKKQFVRFERQFNEKIKPWLMNCLKNGNKKEYLEINCYKKNSGPITLHIPEKYSNASVNNIFGLYITQLNEYFKCESNIIQIYFYDIFKSELSNLDPSL